jgi:hypothetical protein
VASYFNTKSLSSSQSFNIKNAPFSLNKRGKSMDESMLVRRRIISAKEVCSGSKGRTMEPRGDHRIGSRVIRIIPAALNVRGGRVGNKCSSSPSSALSGIAKLASDIQRARVAELDQQAGACVDEGM